MQFVAEDDGRRLAPSVQLPADTSRADLELLANRLTGATDDPTPFAFYLSLPPSKDTPAGAPTRVAISTSIAADVLAHERYGLTTEDTLTLVCAPCQITLLSSPLQSALALHYGGRRSFVSFAES